MLLVYSYCLGTRRRHWMPFRPPFAMAGKRLANNKMSCRIKLIPPPNTPIGGGGSAKRRGGAQRDGGNGLLNFVFLCSNIEFKCKFFLRVPLSTKENKFNTVLCVSVYLCIF